MNQNKLHKCMDSMMNVLENMEMQMYGLPSHLFSIIFHLLQLLKVAFSVFMEVSPQVLILLIKSNNLIESWRYHMKDQYVTFCGLTLMIDVVGVLAQGVRVIRLVKTSVSNSTIQMT